MTFQAANPSGLKAKRSAVCARRRSAVWTGLRTLAALLLITAGVAGPASAAPKSAAMVIDANTGKTLYARSADAERYPASLTKMMTLYMVFSEIEAGRMSPTTRIKMTASAAKRPPSKLGLRPGQSLTVREAIRALITKSANDVAAAVAEHIAGSEPNFARRMTARARSIGMRSTTFKNASGLTHPGQVTTARDMLTLALRLQDDYPGYFHLFSTRAFKFGKKTYRNHNTLLRSMRGVNGIKTGYTRASGFNLVTSMRHGKKHVVAAVFGGKTARARNARMRSLLYSAMRKASTRKTRRPASMLIAKPSQVTRPVVRTAARTKKAAPRPIAQPRGRTIVAGPPASPAPRPYKPAAMPPAPQPRIAMARVRTVSVLPPQAAPAPRPETLNWTQQPIGTPRDLATTVAPRPRVHPAAVQPASPPPRAPLQFARADVQPTMPAQLQARVVRGRPPSTLGAQANRLSGTARSPSQRHFGAGLARMEDSWGLNGPRPAAARQPVTQTANRPRGSYQIQVGAFPTSNDAERRAQDVRRSAPQILAGYQHVTMPVMVGGKQLWRARFSGFASAQATETCNELRRNNIDCFVARP